MTIVSRCHQKTVRLHSFSFASLKFAPAHSDGGYRPHIAKELGNDEFHTVLSANWCITGLFFFLLERASQLVCWHTHFPGFCFRFCAAAVLMRRNRASAARCLQFVWMSLFTYNDAACEEAPLLPHHTMQKAKEAFTVLEQFYLIELLWHFIWQNSKKLLLWGFHLKSKRWLLRFLPNKFTMM